MRFKSQKLLSWTDLLIPHVAQLGYKILFRRQRIETGRAQSVHCLVDGKLALVDELGGVVRVACWVLVKVTNNILESLHRLHVGVFILLVAKSNCITCVV